VSFTLFLIMTIGKGDEMELLAWCRFFCQDTWPSLDGDGHRVIDKC
jgi:hypothetical protein